MQFAHAGTAIGRDFVLSIGVGAYTDDFWPELRFPVADAQNISQALGEGTDRQKQIHLLINTRATLAEVRRTMKSIEQTITSKDNLMVYVSGHGSLAPGKSGGLEQVIILNDTNHNSLLNTALSHEDLRQWVNRVPSKRKLVILATCHSGVGKSKLPPQSQELLAGNKGSVVELDGVSEGVMVLAASSRGETAREDGTLGGDIYTHFFIEGMRAGDRNQDGAVTAIEAHDFARDRTFVFSKGKQRPTVEFQAIGNADLIIRGQASARGLPVLNAYNQEFAGLEIQTEKGSRVTLPTGLPLHQGHNRVDIFSESGRSPVASFNVKPGTGDQLTLDDIFAPPPYRLGLVYNWRFWDDKKFRTATASGDGRKNGTGFRVNAGYVINHLLLELGYLHSIFSDAEPLPGVALKVRDSTATLSAVWLQRNIRGWEWGIGMGLHREQLHISLEDQATHDRVEWSVAAILPALRAQAGWTWHDFTWTGVIFREFGRLKLDEENRINADKTSVELGLSYSFGGVARRLK